MSRAYSEAEARSLVESTLALLRYTVHASAGRQQLLVHQAVSALDPFLTDEDRERRMPEIED